jgi:hypothetical protein
MATTPTDQAAEPQPVTALDTEYRTCGRCSYDTYGGDSDLQHHLRTRHGVQVGPSGLLNPAADEALTERLTRLKARTARLDVSAREERARLGAQCGDMSAATMNDTSLRLARMEAVQEELGYAMDRLQDGASLQQVLNRAVVALAGAAGPLGGNTTEVQRARVAGLAEVVHILQDELANR